MKNSIFIISLLSILTFTSCSNYDSGPNISKTFPISEFSNLELEVVGEVYFEQADSFYMHVTGGSNLIEDLKISNDDDELTIELKNKDNYSGKKNDLTIRVGSPHLSLVDFNSVGTFFMENNFKGNQLTIENNGVGEIKINEIHVTSMNLISKGVGKVEVKGTAVNTFINSEGVGEIDSKDLKSKNTTVKCEGVGSISVHASENIDISLSGIGNLEYYGNPKEINTNISGLGKAKNMDK
ncbi:head GIN domain-containing protein [Brumimicrobium mesophilum]|uniref:head GIN domain-containing protein n=1 Tax=Brumimicrobium mesophilum TaxID=392717 RepID=UPI000D142551|nr:head GIN domain-containing protein [Brumimicrobium mesophilum]